MRTQSTTRRTLQAITSAALLAACGADYDMSGPLDADAGEAIGSVEQGLSAQCGGDDSNALVASLAVATANELGRWDVNTDFTVKNGKLELSATGSLHCGTACGNITALLRLQDDASSVITNHSPSTYRSKLTSWYGAQKGKLDNLVVNTMLNVDKGVYRIKSASSGKYVVPANGSRSSGAALQQSNAFNTSTASQWRVVLKGAAHQLVNVQSGLCADLSSNTTSFPTSLVQRACSSSATQRFNFSVTDKNDYYIRPGNAPGAGDATRALMVANASISNGAAIVQHEFRPSFAHEHFLFEPVGTPPQPLLALARAVYTIKAGHSGMNIGVSSGSLADGASVVQQAYAASDDRFHWYLTPLGGMGYQLINRRTGSCLDLQDANSSTSRIVQRRCSTSASQNFYFNATGEGSHVLWTSKGVTVDVPNGSQSSGAQLVQGSKAWQPYNKLTFEPITAGEPHRLTFDRAVPGGPCGDYYWYDVAQPNGEPLDDPASTYVQLIFAGGKQTPTGSDANPFIAQQVSGNQVAIDPTYGLNDNGSTSSGSCTASCAKVSKQNVAGQCCSCAGVTKKFVKAAWNAQTFVCQ
jgi:hypothetical protein